MAPPSSRRFSHAACCAAPPPTCRPLVLRRLPSLTFWLRGDAFRSSGFVLLPPAFALFLPRFFLSVFFPRASIFAVSSGGLSLYSFSASWGRARCFLVPEAPPSPPFAPSVVQRRSSLLPLPPSRQLFSRRLPLPRVLGFTFCFSFPFPTRRVIHGSGAALSSSFVLQAPRFCSSVSASWLNSLHWTFLRVLALLAESTPPVSTRRRRRLIWASNNLL